MVSLLALAIGIGLVVSLLFSEIFGLAAGGMVVPGYIALFLDQPWSVAITLGTGLGTFLIVRVIATVVIIYGRRRTVMMILVGYLLGVLARTLEGSTVFGAGNELQLIGHIIPGLIAIWIDRQGLLETFTALLTAGVVVRLVLVLFVGAELMV